MKTTLLLDLDLLMRAREATGISSKTQVIHEGLKSLLEREARRSLLLAKGSAPSNANLVPRKRF